MSNNHTEPGPTTEGAYPDPADAPVDIIEVHLSDNILGVRVRGYGLDLAYQALVRGTYDEENKRWLPSDELVPMWIVSLWTRTVVESLRNGGMPLTEEEGMTIGDQVVTALLPIADTSSTPLAEIS